MPVAVSYPGVYIHEVPSGVRTISSVGTSIAAFVGYTAKGRDHRAKRIFSFADFVRAFGGLASDSELSYAVQHFFDNGGTDAYIVRVPRNGATQAVLPIKDKLAGGGEVLVVTALSTGEAGNAIVLDVDYDGIAMDDEDEFNLSIRDTDADTTEVFRKVSMDKTKSNFVGSVVNDEDSGSRLVSLEVKGANRPAQTGTIGKFIALDGKGKPKDIDTSKNLMFKFSADFPKNSELSITDKEITLYQQGEAPPASTAALCRQLERKINAEMPAGASVSCSVVKLDDDGKEGLRVVATIPEAFDAALTFASGPSGGEKADVNGVLKLGVGAAVNVSHYWLGSERTAAAFGSGKPDPGEDGTGLPEEPDLIGDPATFKGIYALDKVDLFNILCIPDATRVVPGSSPPEPAVKSDAVYSKAIKYCESRRAFLLIDPPPDVGDIEQAMDWRTKRLTVRHKNSAAYFPRLRLPDPLNKQQLRTFAPSGVIAGLYARIDAARGVWKAPAGLEATLSGVQGMAYKLNDPENGALNPLGINCLRFFPIYGAVSWGARTLEGADEQASEWKYVPVRRFALFLEESLFRGTKWVVFEPNDEPLWAQIRLNIGAFLQTLFRQGAFQGKTPQEAYFVKCDRETTTQDDINRGVVNVVVGFAPLKPAEFVILHIQQMAGQIQT